MPRIEELVLEMWNGNNGMMPEEIAEKLCLDKEVVESIIEESENYE
jgi:orotate phosphoribosyltransferase-like protein